MVNIGGRSNGCVTCLRKHVRCDEGKPVCLKCFKAGIPCEGYRGLPVTFDPHVQKINHTNNTQGHAPDQEVFEVDEDFSMIDRNPASHAESSARIPSLFGHNGIAPIIKRPPRGRPRKSLQVTKKATTGVAKQRASYPEPTVPFELNFSAFKEPMCVSFLVQNFLGHLDTGRKSLLPAWDVDNVSGTARDSVNALALAFYGKANHLPDLVQQGAVCYVNAISKLRHDLMDKDSVWSPSVLLSSILLARYELVASTGSKGWITHAGGVERLFEARGPGRHRSLEERHIFEAARPIIAIKAITDCKRTFLDQDAWLILPWAHDPDRKSAINHLIDIFCIIPGLLEDSKSLHTGTSFVWDITSSPTSPDTASSAARQDPRRVALRQRTQEWYTKLQRWKEVWDRSYPSAVHPVQISSFPRSDIKFPEDIFSYAITFPNFLRANEYQLYNTVVFLLSSLMLSNPPLSSDDREASPSVTDLLGQRWEAAYNICRAVPYDLFEKHGGGGAYLILFPLLTTLRLFGEGSDEGKWIKHVLGSIANKWGLEGERKYMAFEG